MLGAIVGDVAGSRFEWHNVKQKDFKLFNYKCHPTDDTVMSLAVAKALVESRGDWENLGVQAAHYMQALGQRYPRAGYGGRFRQWLRSDEPQPYNSFGNGSAMRVGPVAYAAKSLNEVKLLSRKVTEVTHNHPEGIKGAEAVAVATYMALHGSTMPEIRQCIDQEYYPMDFTLDEIRPDYSFDVSCQGSVPQAIMSFFESVDFEDAIRNAISLGGDSDTIAAICGSIAGAYYGIPEKIRIQCMAFLDKNMVELLQEFEERYM